MNILFDGVTKLDIRLTKEEEKIAIEEYLKNKFDGRDFDKYKFKYHDCRAIFEFDIWDED